MDFGLDNDFESDDSFFDDPKAIKKPKPTRKTPLEDIFGVQDEKDVTKSGQSSLDNIPENNPGTKPKVRFNFQDASPTGTKPPTDTTKIKTPDWLDGPAADLPKKDSLPVKSNPILDDVLTKSDSKKSFDLLDDILPQRGSKKLDQNKPTSFEDILKESKAQRSGQVSLEVKSGPGSLEATVPKKEKDPNPLGLNMILEPHQGTRRGRRGSTTGVTDVLGLFGSGPPSNENLVETKPAAGPKSKGKDIPDWLGVSSTTINKSETTISLPKQQDKKEETEKNTVEVPIEANTPLVPKNLSENISGASQLSENNFQANMSNLQAQESFLLVSLQLKKYEENLSEIKNQQREILKKQEDQFDLFLNKYIEKQKDIEQEVLTQQQRINDHIRILAVRGFEENTSRVPRSNSTEENDEEGNQFNFKGNDALEKIVQSLKQRHDEEFFLMEESYKKQISLLEKSAEQVELRLKEELDNISKDYVDKIEKIKAEHSKEMTYWMEKISNIDEKHKEEIENLKENHNRVLREVKDEFLDQIERYKEQRTRESELFANSAEFSHKLHLGLEKLDKNGEKLEHIQQKVASDYNILSIAREKSIENKEKDIQVMRIALDKCREQAERDRSQLLGLIRTLEVKISEQNQNSQEERWALQQTAATVAARSAAFDREMEFSRASIEREREQLKTFKATVLAEQERAVMQLTEEKLRLSAEKSKLEVSSKLMNNYEVEKIKTEAETAIQVARELTEKLNLERNFVQRQKIELESFRNKLMEKERDLLEREDNVEEMRRNLQQKTNEDRRVMQETRNLENRYKEKLAELQSQAISLSNREKKLAEEKLLLSKERLNLYTSLRSQTHQKKCMLCKAEEEKSVTGYPATDPEFIRLRIEALDDEKNSEVSREDNSTVGTMG